MSEQTEIKASAKVSKSAVEPVVMWLSRVRCWWLGCEPHPQDPAPVEYLDCQHCGERMDYEGLAGINRYSEYTYLFIYWLYRRWFPKPCGDCKKRYGDHSDCIPF